MEILLLVRLTLAAVFAVAGAAKLADRRGTRASLERFGAPRTISGAAAVLLPVLELAVAAALVPAASAWWGAIGALVLLALFSAAVGRTLARGEAADCHCFGALHSAPGGRRVLVRNGGLALLCGVILVGGPNGAGADPNVTTALVVLGVASAGLAIFAWLLLRRNGHLLLRLDAMESELRAGTPPLELGGAPAPVPGSLSVGDLVPRFAAHDLDGERVTRDDLLAGGIPLALVFADGDCAGCLRLLPRLPALIEAVGDELTVCVVTSGSAADARALAREHDLRLVLVQPDHALNVLLRVPAVPAAMFIDGQGRVGAELAKGADRVADRLEARARPVVAGAVEAGS
ncbi:MAG: redoxin domain-containing protein [Solirubrobacteraceae bacterium]